MKKVLGASIGVLTITFMSFANPQQGNIKGKNAQVISEQTGNGLVNKGAKTKVVPTLTTLTKATLDKWNTQKIILATTKNQDKLAQLNYVMKKYLK